MRYLRSVSKEADVIDYILLDTGAKFKFVSRGKDLYNVGVFSTGQYYWLFDNTPEKINPDKFMMVICEIPDRKIVDVNEVLKTAGEL